MPDNRGGAFRPRKKRVAAYFNNGEFTFSTYAPTDGVTGPGREKLIAAVNASREAFMGAYFGKSRRVTKAGRAAAQGTASTPEGLSGESNSLRGQDV